MTAYTFTKITNASGILPMFQQANEWTAGALSMILLAVIGLVMFAAAKRQDTKSSYVVISFGLTLLSTLMYFAEIATQATIGVCIALLAGSIIWFFSSE